MMDNAFVRERANLLVASSTAGEAMERRLAAARTPTITIAHDELAEFTEQFQRVVALLWAQHLLETDPTLSENRAA